MTTQIKSVILIFILLGTISLGKSEEDGDFDEEDLDMDFSDMQVDKNGMPIKPKKRTGYEKCLSQAAFKIGYYNYKKEVKGLVLKLVYTPAYPKDPDIYFKMSSNRAFHYFDQKKRSYSIPPTEAIAFYKRVFDSFKHQQASLSWLNLLGPQQGFNFVNVVEQCVFYTSFLFDYVGFLSELLDNPVAEIKRLSAGNSDQMRRMTYASFYQLSRFVHFLISNGYYVLNLDDSALGLRMIGDFPLMRLQRVHNIFSTCHFDQFDGVNTSDLTKNRPKGKDKKVHFKDNKRFCYNASAVQLMNTFGSFYGKLFGKPLRLQDCLTLTTDVSYCPPEIVALLTKEKALASQLRRVQEQRHLSDYEFLNNIVAFIEFFGKLLSPKFNIGKAIKEFDEDEDPDAENEPEEEEDEEEQSQEEGAESEIAEPSIVEKTPPKKNLPKSKPPVPQNKAKVSNPKGKPPTSVQKKDTKLSQNAHKGQKEPLKSKPVALKSQHHQSKGSAFTFDPTKYSAQGSKNYSQDSKKHSMGSQNQSNGSIKYPQLGSIKGQSRPGSIEQDKVVRKKPLVNVDLLGSRPDGYVQSEPAKNQNVVKRGPNKGVPVFSSERGHLKQKIAV